LTKGNRKTGFIFTAVQTSPQNFDPISYLRSGEQIIGCDAEHFERAKRLSDAEKEIRDLLLYGIWRTDQLKSKSTHFF